MVGAGLCDPVLLHHLEEKMGAEHDLDLIKAVGWHCHSDHITQSVSEWVVLHLKVKTIRHLDQSLDCDGLEAEFHDHDVIHESVEGRSRSVLESAGLGIEIDPDFLLHHIVHQFVDFGRHHSNVIILRKLFVLRFIHTESFLNG